VTGGNSIESYISNTFVYDDGIFLPGPDLPEGRSSHCQFTLNETHVFIVGGGVASTFLLDWPAQEWIELENLPIKKLYGGACGWVNTPEHGQGEA